MSTENSLPYSVKVNVNNVMTLYPNDLPKITKEKALACDYFHTNECHRVFGARGSVTDVIRVYRRNGQTKTWVTRPNDFRVPTKHGLYEFNEVNQDNAIDYHCAFDCPLLTMPQLRESVAFEAIPVINEVAEKLKGQIEKHYENTLSNEYAQLGKGLDIEETIQPEPIKYRADIQGAGENEWSTNGIEFDDPVKAEAYARDLYCRWMGAAAWRVVPVSTPKHEKVLEEQKGTVTK